MASGSNYLEELDGIAPYVNDFLRDLSDEEDYDSESGEYQ